MLKNLLYFSSIAEIGTALALMLAWAWRNERVAESGRS